MGPINYSLGGPDPSQMLLQGLGQGLQINQLQQQQAAAQAQAQAQQQMNAELEAASRDPRLIPSLMVRYPQLAEKFKVGLDSMTAEQQRGALSNNTEVAAAIASGKPEIAVDFLTRQQELRRNQGDTQGADALGRMIQQAKEDPDALLLSTMVRINGITGGDKVSEGILKLFDERRKAAKAPADLREAEAKATSAEAKAKYADSQALADLQKTGWDIEALKSDIAYKRETARIAAINASLAREGNELKRQELRMKIEDAQRARESAVREKVATAEAGASSIDNMLNTIERIKTNRSLGDVVGSIEGRLPAMVTSGMDDEESDAIALIETLGSQAFLAQIPNIKGMGALSNAEGEKLQSALQNLGRAQSEKQFRANLDEAARLLNKGRTALAKSTGVPLGAPDRPAAPGARPPLDSFFTK